MMSEQFEETYNACEHFEFDKRITAETCWNAGYTLGRKRWHWGPAWMVSFRGWINTQLSKIKRGLRKSYSS